MRREAPDIKLMNDGRTGIKFTRGGAAGYVILDTRKKKDGTQLNAQEAAKQFVRENRRLQIAKDVRKTMERTNRTILAVEEGIVKRACKNVEENFARQNNQNRIQNQSFC